MAKKILIFIPTRNTAATIEKTFNLIPEHIRKEAEFIVVDNASTDNSVEVAEKLVLKGVWAIYLLAHSEIQTSPMEYL
jgi:glycosyltransferase involved in cell wall biosynthesis